MNADRFSQLWRRLTGVEAPIGLFDALWVEYSEPCRAYHNVTHIDDCLEQLDQARHLAIEGDEVELAIWFHDALYDSRAGDNEERSAAWADEVLRQAGAAMELRKRISSLIVATRHVSPPASDDEKLLLDIDLSILGRDADTFDAYDRAIRREFGWVPERIYREERARVLKRFLDRIELFHTAFFRERYEEAAQRNLERALRGVRE